MLNPFRYEEPVGPDDLIDREEELRHLLDRVSEGRNTRLTAPRRFGKTSLLRRLLRDAAREGITGIYVDFFGVLTVDEVAERIDRAFGGALDGTVKRWWTGLQRTFEPVVRVSAGPVGGEIAARTPATASQRALLERLGAPAKLHAKHGFPVLVVFDEFQALLTVSDQLDAVFRSEIQHHGGGVAYVFAGSHPGMMAELFGDRRRPFFDQASPVQLHRLAAVDLADYIGTRFESTRRDVGQALDPLLDLAAGHPQRAMQLAYHLWNATPPGGSADSDTWHAALVAIGLEVNDAFTTAWDAFTVSQRRTLAAIAGRTAPLFSATASAHYGTTKGATAQALRTLLQLGDVEEDPSAIARHRIVDPLFDLWIRSGRSWPVTRY